ncbi:hydrolase [Nocardioides rotundus]|uniref:alpha/beta hydrolase family protein n=1 Tax=Nocardioides rotundus TaxID=1774216 RepID=UPI001CBADF61|nr:alpha/beta family hydrolase [Nocardioides rotundus]UAL28498.1 hydrolase [Nocardioides rotundus]
MSRERTVATPHGPGRLITHQASHPVASLLLSHGAGNGVETADLQALAQRLPRQGVSVVLFEQPWKVAGRKVATPPATLDEGLIAAASAMRMRVPLVVGGRSAGARSAARCARGLGASGCLAVSFPLHPPGRPERSRVDELLGARLPTLVVQGERDAMGRPEEFPPGTDLAVVPGADHGMKVAKTAGVTQEEALGILVEAVLEWTVREVVGNK